MGAGMMGIGRIGKLGSTSSAAAESISGFKFLLSGDMQSGTDKILLSGDMQSGTDVLLLSGSL